MNRILLLTISYYFLMSSLIAQNEVIAGNTLRIRSNNLDQEIELQIYLPENYEEGKGTYPSLYILDGQWYYMNGVAIQESLRGDRIMPKMIVVAINMVDRPYRSELFNRWDSFIDFIELELVPYVDQSYQTSEERIVFGWENSGYLSSELILRKNSPFQCAIATSGAGINGDSLELFSADNERYLFLAGSKKDIYSIDQTDNASETLESINPEGLNWEYRLFNEEEHESLAYASMYQGLKFFYHNYGSLVFSSIDEFYEKGGLPYMEKYFLERGERFDLPSEIDASTKNSLIWLAWKRDKFEAFDTFMREFDDILSTRRYANAYWQNRLGQYYLKYKSFDEAIPFFERGINEYPDDRFMAAMHTGLGSAHFGKGDKRLAKKQLLKGIELAKSSNDPKLTEYQKELERISR
ncbi:alpha/beta hydrolase-fold protein [Ekhidna sp. To15]|uniref:alpha/beta hydrolase-fold protein n=1 Tax=Ekhidna sp. To15 TaxID=3395267 RepID=UPI003F524307